MNRILFMKAIFAFAMFIIIQWIRLNLPLGHIDGLE